MEKRGLGRSGISVAPFAFGGNVFGVKVDQAMTNRLLDRFLDAGCNAIDTADVYPGFLPGLEGGESEKQIGNWLAQGGGRREKAVIITKVGFWEIKKGLSRTNILSGAEDSLRRLRTDCIDVYMSHIDDESVPVEETLRAFEDLVSAGKVRSIGASNFSLERLRASHATSADLGIPRYESIQPGFSLVDRAGYPAELQNWCVDEEVGVTTYFSLACGFLTGKYRSADTRFGSWRDSRVEQYLNPRGFAVLEALDAVAARHSATPAQVSLAWIMAQPGISAPVASATTPEQLEELLGSLHLVLSDEDLAQLDRVGF